MNLIITSKDKVGFAEPEAYLASVPFLKNNSTSWALVAQACEPSCSGGRDQEDGGSKPTWANNS
jgi:hypothetical protein